jgi:hypothetical protein
MSVFSQHLLKQAMPLWQRKRKRSSSPSATGWTGENGFGSLKGSLRQVLDQAELTQRTSRHRNSNGSLAVHHAPRRHQAIEDPKEAMSILLGRLYDALQESRGGEIRDRRCCTQAQRQ